VANPTTKRTKKTSGWMVSIYFTSPEDWKKVKRAAKTRKIKPSVLMRDAVLAEAGRVNARSARRPKAA